MYQRLITYLQKVCLCGGGVEGRLREEAVVEVGGPGGGKVRAGENSPQMN